MRHLIAGALILLVVVSPASAWNATGHKIIASIAFRQLKESEQARIVSILKRHPRFAEDFTDQMPDDVRAGSEAVRNEWLFQQAAVWPDMVRSGPPQKRYFNRSEWHYVNTPHFLGEAAKSALVGRLTVNVATEPPSNATLATARMNVVQAIRFARQSVSDRRTAPQDRAVLLAWLFHDVGDIHQPLHAVALFSTQLFPEGDRGGNSIKTRQAGNLHSLWDGFLGRDDSYRGTHNRAIGYLNDARYAAVARDAVGSLDPVVWSAESYALARSAVYDNEVLTAVRKMESAGGPVEQIVLSETYLKAGGDAAVPRVVQAGHRLGAVLKVLAAE